MRRCVKELPDNESELAASPTPRVKQLQICSQGIAIANAVPPPAGTYALKQNNLYPQYYFTNDQQITNIINLP